MLYLICTVISSVDLAHYRVCGAKDVVHIPYLFGYWVSGDCATSELCCPHVPVNQAIHQSICGYLVYIWKHGVFLRQEIGDC